MNTEPDHQGSTSGGTVLGSATVQVLLDLAGIVVAASSGALVGVRHQMHYMGCLLLGLVTGLGGGVVRDVLLGAVLPASLLDWRYPVAGVVAAAAAQHLQALLARLEGVVDRADAVWLGLFSVAGALKAVHLGAPPLAGVLMGVLTGIGGGVLRDVLVNRRPVVLTEQIYTLPSLLASLVVVGAPLLGWSSAAVTLPAAGLCTAVRLLAIRRRWRGPSVPRR